MNEKKKHYQGDCPHCGSDNLDYGETVFDDDNLYFPFKCRDCSTEGKEWYHTEWIESEITK